MAEEPKSSPLDLTERNRRFMQEIPFHRRTGIEIVEVERGRALMKLPYSPELVGNPDTGVLHGGIVTALLDACCGLAVFMSVDRPMAIATLELRIDYLRPATRGEAVFAQAECYRMTPHVAFARAEAFHEGSGACDDAEEEPKKSGGDPNRRVVSPPARLVGANLIASCTGTFMLGTKPGKRDKERD